MGLDKKIREIKRTDFYRHKVGIAYAPHIGKLSTDEMGRFIRSIESFLAERAHCCHLHETDVRGREIYRYQPSPIWPFKLVTVYFAIDPDKGDDIIFLVNFKAT